MSRPNLSAMPSVDAGQLAWDAKVNQALEDIKAIIEDGPFPIAEYGTAEALPAAGSYDRCIAAKDDATIGWHVRLSDGSSWLILPTQAAHVSRLTDNSGGTAGSSVESTGSGTADDNFATILAKLGAIQDALEASGVMAEI